jgi:hypothetical protein
MPALASVLYRSTGMSNPLPIGQLDREVAVA